MPYWDTSCLIKLYAPEPDSEVFRAEALRSATLVTSEITRLELHAALWRKQSTGSLPADGARLALAVFDSDVASGLIDVRLLDSATVLRYEGIIEQCYNHAPPINLRTLDAIHVATAATSGEPEIVATDKRLREAALSLGFTLHPSP